MENENSRLIKFDFITKKEFTIFDDNISHYQTKIKNTKCTGFGTAQNKDLAILKSISESVERYYFHNYFTKLGLKNSNGLACHTNSDSALNAAILEIYERHVLISHWHKQISPFWITNNLNQYFDSFEIEILNKISILDYEISFGILAIINNQFVAVSSIRKKNKTGYAISTAASSSLNLAIKKCLEDHIRVVDLIELREMKHEDLYNKMNLEEIRLPSHHLEFYLNPKNWIGLEWFFQSNPDVRNYNTKQPITKLLKDNLCTGIDFYIAYASSDAIENIYFGLPHDSYFKALEIKEITNTCPHPLA